MYIEVIDGFLVVSFMGETAEFGLGEEAELARALRHAPDGFQMSSSVWGIWDELLNGALALV